MEDNDCIDRNFQFRQSTQKDKVQAERFLILTSFVNKEKSSISAGCGSYEPLVIGTCLASDISPRAEHYLRQLGFTGEVVTADVRNLPFRDKQFKIAVCSEVIEHLNTEGDVALAFFEINRISESWVITTPAGYSPDPDHKFHFSKMQLQKIISPHSWKIFKKGFFFYITNDEERFKKCISPAP